MTGVFGWCFFTSSETAIAPWIWGIQWRSMPKALVLMRLISSSGSYPLFLSILYARLMILTLMPKRPRYSERLANPIGYISKIGVEGMTSLIGPCSTETLRKS